MEGRGDPSTSTIPEPCSSTSAAELLDQLEGVVITEDDKVNVSSIRVDEDEHDNGGSPPVSKGYGVVDGSGESQHPLLIEVVLRKIFTHFSGLEMETLFDFRLVCRTWQDVFLSTWRSTATPKIVYSKRHRTYSLTDSDGERTLLGDFLEFWENQCHITPYRQVHLDHWRFAERKLGFVTDATRFWDLVGGHLTKLTLEHCNSALSRDFLRLINRSCPNLETLVLLNCSFSGFGNRDQIERNCIPAHYRKPAQGEHPNLKSLHIICTGDSSRVSTSLRVTYMELLSHFPCLTSVHLTTGMQANEMLYFLRAVERIRMQDADKLPITMLATGSPIQIDFVDEEQDEELLEYYYYFGKPPQQENREMIKLLQDLYIPLQSIELTWELSLTEIRILVETSATSLATLIALNWGHWETDPVTYRWVRHRCSFPFGVMLPNLQVLHMLENFCESLEFLKVTPNLTTLLITGPSYISSERWGKEAVIFSNTSIVEMSDVKLLKLTILDLTEFIIGEEVLQCLTQWMPHVRKLQMVLNDSKFAIVCENWTELTELKVLGEELTDAGVTGRRPQMGTPSSSWNVTSGDELQANISCLRHLELFKALLAPLTGASVFHGFLKLASLRQIYFPILGKVGDEKAKDALQKKGVRISRQDWGL